MSTFKHLLQANLLRDKEWDTENKVDFGFRAAELGGEVGEALEVAFHQTITQLQMAISTGKALNNLKKLQREANGMVGSKASKEDLADELADVIICCGLVAMQSGIDLDKAVESKFNATSEKYGLLTRIKLS